MKIRRYQSIRAWQLADHLAVSVYQVSRIFPKEERYGLVSQMRRSSVSIAANIAEGSHRASKKEYLQFLSVARGSLAELRYYLHLSRRLAYLAPESYEHVDQQADEVGRVLYGLMRSIDNSAAPMAPIAVEPAVA